MKLEPVTFYDTGHRPAYVDRTARMRPCHDANGTPCGDCSQCTAPAPKLMAYPCCGWSFTHADHCPNREAR